MVSFPPPVSSRRWSGRLQDEYHVDDTTLVGREDGVCAGPDRQVHQGIGREAVQEVEGVLAGAAEAAEWAVYEGDALRKGIVLPEMVVGCQEPPVRPRKRCRSRSWSSRSGC